MSENLFQENFLIEGFDPEKLREMQEKNKRNVGWETVYGAYQNNKILQAEVSGIERIGDKTCAIVMVEEVRGIIPIEFFGVQGRRKLREFMGREVAFTVVNYNREAEVFTASRIEARKQMAKHTLKRIEVGSLTPFVVTDIRSGGLFGDIGGLTAYIPTSEVRYGWVDDIFDEYKVNDQLVVKITEIEEESSSENGENTSKEEADNKETEKEVVYRITASAKALQENPWDADGIAHKFPRRSEQIGTVSGIVDFGVFVRLADGVDSLARHMKFENVVVGDKVNVRILDIDVENEQIRSKIVRKLN